MTVTKIKRERKRHHLLINLMLSLIKLLKCEFIYHSSVTDECYKCDVRPLNISFECRTLLPFTMNEKKIKHHFPSTEISTNLHCQHKTIIRKMECFKIRNAFQTVWMGCANAKRITIILCMLFSPITVHYPNDLIVEWCCHLLSFVVDAFVENIFV